MSAHSCVVLQGRIRTLLLMTMLVTACTAWHTTDVTPQAELAAHQQKTVRITRTDGRRLVLQHAVLRGDTLEATYQQAGDYSSTPVRIALTDVRQVETVRFSPDRTVILGVVLAGMVVAAFGATYLIACSNGGCN